MYEFELKGYKADGSTKHKFNKLTNSPEGQCGSIKVTDGLYDKLKNSSCDTLSSGEISQSGGILNWNDFLYFATAMLCSDRV